MKPYPLIVHLENRPCLVIGAGKVGSRKVARLLEAGARVDAISRSVDRLTPHTCLRVFPKAFEPEDLDRQNYTLVFAATADPQLNLDILMLCRKKNILCNTSSGQQRDFSGLIHEYMGQVCIAVYSAGAGAHFSRSVLAMCKKALPVTLSTLAGRIRRVRDEIIATQTDKNERIEAISTEEIVSQPPSEQKLRKIAGLPPDSSPTNSPS